MDRERIVELERARLEALVARDMAVADRLHAADYQLITPDGSAMSKVEYLGRIQAGSLRYRVFTPIGEMAVRLSADIAILRYRCRIDIVADGHEIQTDAWHTDVWQRERKDWCAAWSHATAITGQARCDG
ncbi:MAG TPA: nuclear transport factor 2 family protein [Thermomicrobiales bacterium]|nr:nuclear transport factor 2 family protein [Thermomicrobiales bacterium]HRA46897.1 nuclear transport factor 2 family protein [Thermomicrobiales bacterium]